MPHLRSMFPRGRMSALLRSYAHKSSRLGMCLVAFVTCFVALTDIASSVVRAQGSAWDGVPSLSPNFSQDVETWWTAHPFNPDSSQYRPNITSPTPVVNVLTQHGGNIQSAIDALPATGGTLNLPAGTYTSSFSLLGKSNVHIISDTGALIRTSSESHIAGCAEALDYPAFARDVIAREPVEYACATSNRIRNIYLRNITFDGANVSQSALLIRAARDTVFDNVTFQNYVDPGSGHTGLVNGSAMLDNIWFRNSRFVGRAQ
jgi:hypothetical protein